MATKQLFLTAMAALIGSGVQAAPDWTAAPTATLQVRWVRVNEIPQFEVRDGVCVIYMPDFRYDSPPAADDLLRGCIATGKASAKGVIPGTVQMHWHEVSTMAQVVERSTQIFGLRKRWFDGFYFKRGDICHIVTGPRGPAVGHELKHCFDGDFHL